MRVGHQSQSHYTEGCLTSVHSWPRLLDTPEVLLTRTFRQTVRFLSSARRTYLDSMDEHGLQDRTEVKLGSKSYLEPCSCSTCGIMTCVQNATEIQIERDQEYSHHPKGQYFENKYDRTLALHLEIYVSPHNLKSHYRFRTDRHYPFGAARL